MPVTACTAHKSNGDPCRMHAIVGGKVCPAHGGRAPQVRAAAQARLEQALPTALDRLIELMKKADQDSVSFRAAVEVLERTLGKTQDKLKLSGDTDEPLEIVISRPTLPSSD